TMKILIVNDKKEEKFLRTKTADFDFAKFTKKEINDLIKKMKEIMLQANGIGLSANQIGLNLKMFVALIPEKPLKRDEKNKIIMPSPDEAKFYAIFNPEIIKFSKQTEIIEEGCLSVPGIHGGVKRSFKITATGQDKNGRKIKIKAEGLTARVFQHEIDHLNGILFIDKINKIYKITSKQ
ncbi:peptide deformylase, partial [Candidatus Wolfebacteria bacterium CG_4_9_14_3_um_filter_37_9]